MSFKVLKKERVLTSGTGSERVVLCFDSGLVYQYDDPSNVLAVYDKGRWITPDRPYYSRGGWGSGSSGDKHGNYIVSNTREVLRSIEAKVISVNLPSLMDLGDYASLLKKTAKVKKLKQAAKKLGIDEAEMTQFEKHGLKVSSVDSNKSNPHGRKGIDPFKTLDLYENSVETFLKGKGKAVKIDRYSIAPNLVKFDSRVLALRDSSGKVVLNSEAFQVSEFERTYMGSQSIIQKKIREVSNYSIPFNVLESAGLDLKDTKVLEAGPESDHSINGVDRHFTGALLLENSGRKFLMDLDRIEIGHGIFNVFFSEVDSRAESIESAYDYMKPESVKEAELKGIEVKRQGEWFFIKTGKTLEVVGSEVETWLREEDRKGFKGIARFEISHGKGRPNTLYKPMGFGELDSLVCGIVSHTGREHKDLHLGVYVQDPEAGPGEAFRKISNTETYLRFQDAHKINLDLWEVVPNNTVGNFTIKGDVD